MRRFASLLGPTALLAVLMVSQARVEDFTGKVVGVSDGDTLTVLTEQNRQVKIRLSGIDAPETGQDFVHARNRLRPVSSSARSS